MLLEKLYLLANRLTALSVCVNLIPQHRDKLVSDWSDVKKLYGRYHELVDHYKISISQMAMEFFPIA